MKYKFKTDTLWASAQGIRDVLEQGNVCLFHGNGDRQN